MSPENPSLFIEKAALLKRVGYALIAVGLIFLTFINTAPELYAPRVVLYSYVLLGVGGVLVLLYKSIEIIQHSRLRKRTAYCSHCGWAGAASDWYRLQCCPECDSENVRVL